MRKYDVSIRDTQVASTHDTPSPRRGKKKSIFSRPFSSTKKTSPIHVERESCFTSYGHGGHANKSNSTDPGSLREVCRKLIDLVTCVIPTKKPIGDFCFSRWNVIRVWENRLWVYSRESDRSIDWSTTLEKDVPYKFRKTKRKQPSSPSRQSTFSSPSFSLYRPRTLPFRLFRFSARFPFFFPPPALSLRFASLQHGFLIGPIISRAIIIPKTNSYFLLRNRKLINQSSHWPRRGWRSGEGMGES